jgi:hypothetical protein
MDGMLMYVQKPSERGRRGSMGRHSNGKNVSSGQQTLAVPFKRDVSEGVQATMLI